MKKLIYLLLLVNYSLFGQGGVINNSKVFSNSQKTFINQKLHTVNSKTALIGFTDSNVANYDGSIWEKKSGNVVSNGGTFAGTVIQINSSFYWERKFDEVHSKYFGAKGDGVIDDIIPLRNWNEYGKTLTNPKLVLDKGIYFISDMLQLDGSNYTIEFQGEFISNVIGKPAIRIGSPTINLGGINVLGLKVIRTTIDINSTNGSTGVEIRNIISSKIQILQSRQFWKGIELFGDVGRNGGCSLNKFELGNISDNNININLHAENNDGYINENAFYGGYINHSSSYPTNLFKYGIIIEHHPPHALNNNRFYNTIIEGNSTNVKAIVCSGISNSFENIRLENNMMLVLPQIFFETNSYRCSLIGNGFGVEKENIINNGYANKLEFGRGAFIEKDNNIDVPINQLKSTFSNLSILYSGLNISGIEKFSVNGAGLIRGAEIQIGLPNDNSDAFRVDGSGYFDGGTSGVALWWRNNTIFRTKDQTATGQAIFDAPNLLFRNPTNGYSTLLYLKHNHNIGINTDTPNLYAVLDIASTTKGVLMPRMTTAQRDAIGVPVEGLEVYNLSTKSKEIYNGANWGAVGALTGSFSQASSAMTTFTVSIGSTMSNATYKVNVTPTSMLSAASFYVTNKTTTTFDITYLTALTGTVTFDYAIFR